MLRNEFGLPIQFLIISSVDTAEVESFSTLRQKRWLQQSVSKIAVIFKLPFLWRTLIWSEVWLNLISPSDSIGSSGCEQ